MNLKKKHTEGNPTSLIHAHFAVFTVARKWSQPRSPLTVGWIMKVCLYTR